MSELTKIDNHLERALDRRLEQWKCKPNLEKILTGQLSAFQELEDTLCRLNEIRFNPNEAFGEFLDRIGETVGQERMGLEDDLYRIVILGRIGANVSNGEAERIISVMSLLTQAENIHYRNLGGGEISIGSDGVINPLTTNFLLEQASRLIVGSFRITRLCIYDNVERLAFSSVTGFQNPNSPGMGFSSVYDNSIGGKFGQCYTLSRAIRFNDPSKERGFASIKDPLVGGTFESVY